MSLPVSLASESVVNPEVFEGRTNGTGGSQPRPVLIRVSESSTVCKTYSNGRSNLLLAGAGGHMTARKSLAQLDLWRVHLDQCPECGRVHGGHLGSATVPGTLGRPERHVYEYTQGVSEDIMCLLCSDALQNPVKAPCGHHYCSACVRMLLTRTTGKVACPLDGQVLTRFALQQPDDLTVRQLDDLRVRCPVCDKQVRKSDLQLHLQDPVRMVETPASYESILRPFYMSCPLSSFTVGELNGSSALIRFYRRLGMAVLKRFVLATEDFIVLPDPKMGFQPHTEDDVRAFQKYGGYFNAWWVHPSFRSTVWWKTSQPGADIAADPTAAAAGAVDSNPSRRSDSTDLAGAAADNVSLQLQSLDCSAEPWHESSFMHTWSSVSKPTFPKYLCCLRDLRKEDIPMLETFRADVLRFLRENYLVDEDRVWIYCHYPSSARYSTLHFHIIFSGSEASHYEKYAEKLERPHQMSRQFPLSEVIDVLKNDPDHFETSTLSYFLGDKADLMDPVSAFFDCSPHRYIQGFTFEWDPGLIHATPRVAQTPTSAPGAVVRQVPRERFEGAQSDARFCSIGALECQNFEVKRAVDDIRREVEVLAHQLKRVQQCVSDQDAGGNRADTTSILQAMMAELLTNRSQSKDCLPPFWWQASAIAIIAFSSGLFFSSSLRQR